VLCVDECLRYAPHDPIWLDWGVGKTLGSSILYVWFEERRLDMGLVIIGALALYLLLAIAVVIGAIKFAKQNGKSAKRWGWSAALVMYLIPFWDWIPTVVVHQYYCSKEAGFWIYKTVDQWKKENPGLMETSSGAAISQKNENGYQETHQINQRLKWIIELRDVTGILRVAKREETVIDVADGKALARFVDFSRGNQRSTGAVKFWLVGRACNSDEIHRVRMGKLVDEIYAAVTGGKK
jgi:hypothetical protein